MPNYVNFGMHTVRRRRKLLFVYLNDVQKKDG